WPADSGLGDCARVHGARRGREDEPAL
ncbi:uncharacterized protein METZ01_LOCUS182886, partial [marine metagenome]